MSRMLFCLSVILLIGWSHVQAQTSDLPRFEEDDCPFTAPAGEVEGETLACGYLIVPETRGQADSPEAALAVAILVSPNPDAAADPVVYLAGGPGASALLEVADWTQSPFRAQRDIILIDQRGVGYSFPALECEDFQDADDPDTACYESYLQAGVDLAAYNSAASAADIADLQQVLGLDALNLYGISYGTRLALTIMRDYSDGIRSVVLDSTYPPPVNGLDEQAVNGADAIQHVFEQCALSQPCDDYYGDLETMFYQVVDAAYADPIVSQDPETGDEVETSGDDLVNMLFSALYSSDTIPTLPYGILLLDEGDYDMGLDVLSGLYTRADLEMLAAGEDLPETADAAVDDDAPDGDSEGMFNSVECNEEAPFNSAASAEALAADVPPELQGALLGSVEDELATCAVWDSGQADAIETEPVVSDIPTLVLAGGFDPVTPPVWGQIAADTLSQSIFVEIPHAGHSVLDSGECAVSIASAFLDDPMTPPDTTCASEDTVDFYVPEG